MMIWRRWSIAPSDQGTHPVVGSHPSSTENRNISEIPNMKFGTVIPTTFTAAVVRVINQRAVGIVFSTIAAPLVIQKVLNHGTLAGGQLISGAVGSFLQTAATTASAAAVGSTTGIPLVTAGAAGLAASLSTLSSAAGLGSAGSIIIAGSGLPPRSARGRPGDDITGDKAVRELISKVKNSYY